MSRLGFLLILWIVSGCAYCSDDDQDDFVKSLGFDSVFDDSGIASLASNPMAATILKVDKSRYPLLFDTVVSSSIDSLKSQFAPRENQFDPATFGTNPYGAQNFHPYGQSAKLVQQQPQQPKHDTAPVSKQLSPLRYDIRTVHDANYKVYKPETEEEEDDRQDRLAALKTKPAVAAYFQPTINLEVKHPLEYRREAFTKKVEDKQNYRQNPYITGPSRFRRYTGRSRENLKKSEGDEDDDDPYSYKAEYISKPKAFDESPYSSPYTKKKESKGGYEYPYSYDSGYDHKEYERIKELSEKQAAEIKQNPGNCKEVKKDGMSCMTCKDPKTGGNYESCSYVAEPKNNKYAYSKERKYDSKDEPDEPEHKEEGPKKSQKVQIGKDVEIIPQKYADTKSEKPYSSYKNSDNSGDSDDKYKAYYVHTSNPTPSEALRAASSGDSSEDDKPKAYDYKKALPGFYTDNEQKKDVEHVLAEFKKKDRSACNKVQKNGMTCFQCLDKNGLKHEECMFVSESAPKQSHLAYQELKEFTSKPATLDEGNVGAESQTVTTSSPPAQKSATNSNYDKKSKRKKAPQSSLDAAASNSVPKKAQKVKRSEGSQVESDSTNEDKFNIAPPEEFAGADSRGAYWAETMPRYSAALGVSLPEYMLSRSEHEASFDEAVAGA